MSGRVIWLTGLSGAGKTTLARALMPQLAAPKVFLDGDALREVLGMVNSGFDRDSRIALALTYARFCKLLAEQGLTVVIATISLFHEVHAWNREHLPGYIEVFLDVPEEVRRARDPKGLYAAEQAGVVKQMSGLDTVVDFPTAPHITLSPATESVAVCMQRILQYLESQ